MKDHQNSYDSPGCLGTATALLLAIALLLFLTMGCKSQAYNDKVKNRTAQFR